jgi:hypothetical protein
MRGSVLTSARWTTSSTIRLTWETTGASEEGFAGDVDLVGPAGDPAWVGAGPGAGTGRIPANRFRCRVWGGAIQLGCETF